MEVKIHVTEEELAEFPEYLPEKTTTSSHPASEANLPLRGRSFSIYTQEVTTFSPHRSALRTADTSIQDHHKLHRKLYQQENTKEITDRRRTHRDCIKGQYHHKDISGNRYYSRQYRHYNNYYHKKFSKRRPSVNRRKYRSYHNIPCAEAVRYSSVHNWDYRSAHPKGQHHKGYLQKPRVDTRLSPQLADIVHYFCEAFAT